MESFVLAGTQDFYLLFADPGTLNPSRLVLNPKTRSFRTELAAARP